VPSDGLKLITLCSYLTDTDVTWRQSDWDAFWMVKALKGERVKGYFHTIIAGQRVRFDQSNVGEFVKRIPRALAKMIALEIDGPATLVPIPNSHVTATDTSDFRTFELAKAVAAESGGRFTAVPALVFSEVQQKSHEGGPRSAEHCEQAYRRTAAALGGPIVLIDDVCTAGGHMIGAYRKLHASPTRDVVLACAFGRSTKEQINTPLGPRESTLDVRGPFDL
jgi:hypothetical protein